MRLSDTAGWKSTQTRLDQTNWSGFCDRSDLREKCVSHCWKILKASLVIHSPNGSNQNPKFSYHHGNRFSTDFVTAIGPFNITLETFCIYSSWITHSEKRECHLYNSIAKFKLGCHFEEAYSHVVPAVQCPKLFDSVCTLPDKGTGKTYNATKFIQQGNDSSSELSAHGVLEIRSLY